MHGMSPCLQGREERLEGRGQGPEVLRVPQRVPARQGAESSDRGAEEAEPLQGLPRQLQGMSQEV